MGYKDSIEAIKGMFMAGIATKEEQYTEAPRGYQNAVEDTKSPEREEALSFHKSRQSS